MKQQKKNIKRSMDRKVHINNEIWKYNYIGAYIEIMSPTHKVVSIKADEFKCHPKNYSERYIIPSDIVYHIETQILHIEPKAWYKSEYIAGERGFYVIYSSTKKIFYHVFTNLPKSYMRKLVKIGFDNYIELSNQINILNPLYLQTTYILSEDVVDFNKTRRSKFLHFFKLVD